MGLDMYLSRKKYVGANYEHREVKGEIKIKIKDRELPIDFNRVSYIEEDIGYWRKANAIHNWFVNNIQEGIDNCRDYAVDIEQLKKLLELCKEVKAKAKIKKGKIINGYRFEKEKRIPILEDGEYIENDEEIADILPTTSGCFFGSIEYDQWYMNDINYTIELLEKTLKEEKELNEKGFYSEFVYSSSW